jgi:hypothetical protein
MGDIVWLTSEARALHGIFHSLFYGLITTFLLLGVFVEYFKWPLGKVPSFSVLVGRALVASILLHSYPEITNAIADVTDALAAKIGEFHKIDLVIAKLGDKLEDMSASWVSVKETISIAVSYLSFFALYFSKYVAEGIFLFTWILCFVFSPLLIALFVLPTTAGATKALFRTLFEISCWKIVWSVLASLLWSSALTTLNEPGSDVSFVAVICMNLALAGSLLLTPWVVHSLASSGLAGFTNTLGGIAIGASFITPDKLLQVGKAVTTKGLRQGHGGYQSAKDFLANQTPKFTALNQRFFHGSRSSSAGGLAPSQGLSTAKETTASSVSTQKPNIHGEPASVKKNTTPSKTTKTNRGSQPLLQKSAPKPDTSPKSKESKKDEIP